ncbi:MAG: ATP-binding protein [Desulfurivibrionaceae bacterium]
MRKQPTISVYLLGMNLLLLCGLFPLFSYFILRETAQLRDVQLERNVNMIRQSLVIRSASLTRSTAMSVREAVAGYDFTFLQNLVVEVARDDPEILYCMIMDLSQNVVAHSDINLVGSRLTGEFDNKAASLMNMKFPAQRPSGIIPVEYFWPTEKNGNSKGVLETVFPVYSGDVLWGIIRCGYSLAPLEEEIARTKTEWLAQMSHVTIYIVAVLSVFFLAGLTMVIATTRYFVRATRALHAGVQQVAAGDLDREIAPQDMVCREFADLAGSFNRMTKKLRLMRQQLDEYTYSLEKKVLERTQELQTAQDIMVRQAHEAGMAEIAIGVLHNIGNAITPAQVGTTMLCNHLAESPLRHRLAESLAPILDFLEGKRELSPAEKERCFNIIRYLPLGITEELDRAVSELRAIIVKHRHIESIIRLQMRYARIMDFCELLDINNLVKDALKILGDDIAKRKITVVMHLEEVPPVKVEETKLLQVLVNLIKNGYEAMDGSEVEKRELVITTGTRHENEQLMVLFSVADSGCGFTEEEKKRFFKFGYSTKERGSGFGLHACANYVIANNGVIEAASDGPGKGARFKVLFPAAV